MKIEIEVTKEEHYACVLAVVRSGPHFGLVLVNLSGAHIDTTSIEAATLVGEAVRTFLLSPTSTL